MGNEVFSSPNLFSQFTKSITEFQGVKNMNQFSGLNFFLTLLQDDPLELPFIAYLGVPMLIFWLITFLFTIMIVEAKLMSKKVATVFTIHNLIFQQLFFSIFCKQNVLNIFDCKNI